MPANKLKRNLRDAKIMRKPGVRTVYFTEERYKWILEESARTGKSVSEIIGEGIDRLRKEPAPQNNLVTLEMLGRVFVARDEKIRKIVGEALDARIKQLEDNGVISNDKTIQRRPNVPRVPKDQDMP